MAKASTVVKSAGIPVSAVTKVGITIVGSSLFSKYEDYSVSMRDSLALISVIFAFLAVSVIVGISKRVTKNP